MNGYRGYITSRPYLGNRAPQHIQNLVIRHYCQQQGLHYLLSVTEHVMPNCYMIMKQLWRDLPSLEGAVLYSVFQLPEDDQERQLAYQAILRSGRPVHTAVERLVIHNEQDIHSVEDIWRVQKTLLHCPSLDDLTS